VQFARAASGRARVLWRAWQDSDLHLTVRKAVALSVELQAHRRANEKGPINAAGTRVDRPFHLGGDLFRIKGNPSTSLCLSFP
jgi:hypothetical protein